MNISEKLKNLSPEQLELLRKKMRLKGMAATPKERITKRTDHDAYPMSAAQMRLWFLDQLDHGSAFYNVPSAVTINGRIDAGAMEKAINQVVARHEILRSCYIIDDTGNPQQKVHAQLDIPLERIDLSDVAAESVEGEIASRLKTIAATAFQLQEAPLLRAFLLSKSQTEHVLMLNMHHIIVDGWSIGIILQEVLTLYEAERRNKPSPLPEPMLQFADYAEWQNNKVSANNLDKQLVYWKNYLHGMPPVLEIFTDFQRPSVLSHKGDHFKVELDAATTAALRQLSREQQSSLFNTLMAATQLFFYKYTQQEDFGIGAPIANRFRKELESIVGFFVNTIALRAQFSEQITFIDLLKRVKNDILLATENQDIPFEKIVETVQPHRDLSHSPLFQVMFDLQTSPLKAMSLSDINMDIYEMELETAKFDLLFLLMDKDETIQCTIEYNTELFKSSTVELMAVYYLTLLRHIAQHPEYTIDKYSLLTTAQQHQIIHEWNDTQTDYPRDRAVHTLFEEQVEKSPDAVAVKYENDILTYRQLNERANQLTRHLIDIGVQPGARVAIYMERSVDMIVSIMAILKAGACYVPLDLAYPAARIDFMLDDTQAPVVLTQRQLADEVPLGDFSRIAVDADWERIAAQPITNPNIHVEATAAAYIIYTSGSTGKPKGVVVPHRAITRLVIKTNYITITPEDIIAQVSNAAFDAATFEIWGAFLTGARLVGISKEVMLSSQTFVERLRAENITAMFLTVAYFNQMTNEIPGAFRSLKTMMFGGEAADASATRHAINHEPPQHLLNVYGPTENTTFSTFYEIRVDDDWVNNVPIGKPIANSIHYVLDRHLHICPVGVPGELYLGGDGLMIEYLNRPELNAEKLIQNPFGVTGDRLYKTGDLVRYTTDGSVEFLERIDQQVKIRGFRIELGEIESLLKQNELISDTVVLARANKLGEKQLVAYVVPCENVELDLGRLKTSLLEKLPDYMVPTFFVSIAALPLTPNGKVDKKALPDPTTSLERRGSDFVAPRNKLESYLAGVWQELLGIEKIGIHDNFFDLGGNSLKAAVLMNRLQKDLGESAHVAAVFKAPTIDELSMYIAEYYTDQVKSRFGEEATKDYHFEVAVDESRIDVTVDANKLQKFRDLINPLRPQPENIKSMPKNSKAVFVLSPPRSGSTLLRVMLAGNSQLFSPPELDLLTFNTLRERKAAFSQEGLEIWLQATVRALMELKQCAVDEATQLMSAYEERNLSTKEFYRELQLLLGGRLLVDKTPTYPFDPHILKRAEENFADAHYIHLVRHPYAMIYSFIEAKLDQNFFRYEHAFTRRELAEIIWIISNQNILAFLQDVPQERQHRVRFEDILLNPQAELEHMCKFLGIDFQPAMLEPYKGKKMTDGVQKNVQMVGDFKFYLHKNINTSVADKWKTFHKHDFLCDIGWDLAAQFGYPVEKDLAEQLREADKVVHIARVPRDKDLHLSFAQQRLWFLDQFEPGNNQYNIPIAVRLLGDVDLGVFELTLNTIIERHETLRTTFDTMADGRVRQIVRPALKIELPLVDLRDYAGENREHLAQQIANAEAAKPFDLQHGPLIRAKMIRLAITEYVLVIVMHHIISDGWSVNVFIREFTEIHEALLHKKPLTLPPLTVQYADFAAWQRQWLSGERLETELSYWKNQLADVPPALELPTDHPRSMTRTHKGREVIYNLSKELSEAIKKMSRDHGTTVFMTLMAAFQVLLARYANQTDILVGTPIANRTRKEIEPLIGFFVNTLVLRADLSDNPSFAQLLRQVKNAALEAYDHQNIPFEKLVDALQPERDTQHTPFFQVMFAMQESALESLELTNVRLSVFQISSGAAKFDLSMSMVERFGTLRGQLEYDADLFDESTIQSLVHHFEILLHNLTSNPDMPVGDVTLLDTVDYHTIVCDFNSNRKSLPEDICLPALFEAQVDRTPHRLAVSDQDNQVTFAELNERANRCAHYLRKHGVGSESLVGVSMTRSVDSVVAILAILKAGAGYVPLDPDYPRERLEFIFADTGLAHLLTQSHVVDQLPISNQQVFLIDRDSEKLSEYPCTNPVHLSAPDNIAYVIYTSGSTGKPKGVMISQRSAYNLFVGLQDQIYTNLPERQLVASLNAPLLFDASVQQLVTLLRGNHLCIIPADVRTDGEALLCYIQDHRIDVLDCVPSQLKLLMNAGLFEQDIWKPLALLPGGEAIDEATWRVLQTCGTQIYNMYGPTECTVDATTCYVNHAPDQPTIGQPLTNAQIYILDKNRRAVPIGVVGEICISGDGLARGYWNRPELTAEKFIPNPFSDNGERLYCTGDLGRFMRDGNIQFLGRLDHQVKLRGYRMELGEIEANLKEHPAIKETIVLVREDEPGDKRLVSYYTLVGEEKPTAVELRDFLLPRLPDYMIPSYFVVLDKFPLTPNAKIDRKALPRPQIERSDLASDYAEASTETEKVLVEVWQQVLGVEDIGIDDNFFELGGDSILSIQVIARAFQRGLKLSPKQIFTTPTIRGLAAHAGIGIHIDAEQGLVTGDVPLTPVQHWFFEQGFANVNHWNQSLVLDVMVSLNTDLLEKVIVKVIEHHDILRLRFNKQADQWSAFITRPENNVPFQVFDLMSLSDAEAAKALEVHMRELQSNHDVMHGPIFRCAYFNMGEGRPDKLFITIHHMAIDGLSWRILLEDIVHAYDTAVNGQEIQLPAKTTSFKQWATKLREHADSLANEVVAPWLKAPRPVDLPVDFPGEDVEASTKSLTVELSVSETFALLQEVPRIFQTQITDILLTALVTAFSAWTGEPELRVALEGHGREDLFEDIDISRTIGWFTTLYPVQLDISGSGTLSEKVQAVKAQLAAVPQNGFYYGLARYLSSDTDITTKLAAIPEPQVAFNYLGQFKHVANDPRFRVSDEQSRDERDPNSRRPFRIFVSGKIVQDQLQMSFLFSDKIYKAETIKALANSYIQHVRDIVEHSKSGDGYSRESIHIHAKSGTGNVLEDVLSELDLE
ncbi:amino acid adenylation domain-containing protein [candidate division KSB1 bacterium]|nr:amino acid adenylation domain-containing protein [candidate division KSB1 bacterium]RQW04812.1 MAG: amino acid adenylation domain-containing protein [candidate division KSB1 bacterium]